MINGAHKRRTHRGCFRASIVRDAVRHRESFVPDGKHLFRRRYAYQPNLRKAMDAVGTRVAKRLSWKHGASGIEKAHTFYSTERHKDVHIVRPKRN